MRKQTNDTAPSSRVKRGRAVLVGYGLDDDRGHLRYTRGNSFELIGGSETAHDEMQQRALQIQEEVAKLGFSLDGMTYEQFQMLRAVVDRVNCE